MPVSSSPFLMTVFSPKRAIHASSSKCGSPSHINPTFTLDDQLLISVELNNIPFARSLLEAGANVDSCDHVTHLPMIHMAIKNNNLELLQLLLEFGANVETPTPHLRMTPLMQASACKNLEAMKILIANGAAVDGSDRNDRTAYGVIRQGATSVAC
jgi:ankyrin repeat protein